MTSSVLLSSTDYTKAIYLYIRVPIVLYASFSFAPVPLTYTRVFTTKIVDHTSYSTAQYLLMNNFLHSLDPNLQPHSFKQ